MNELELNSTEIKIKLNGVEHKLRMPTPLENIDYKEKHTSAGEDERAVYKAIIDFLDILGLPSDVSKKLESGVLLKILELIVTKKI